MEIKAGMKFKCVKGVVMHGTERIAYTEGKIYKSDFNGNITDNQGDAHHRWSSGAEKFFTRYYSLEDFKNGIVACSMDGDASLLNAILSYLFPPGNLFTKKYQVTEGTPTIVWFSDIEGEELILSTQSVKDFYEQLPKEEVKKVEPEFVKGQSILVSNDGRKWLRAVYVTYVHANVPKPHVVIVDNNDGYSYVVPYRSAIKKITVTMQEIADWKGVEVEQIEIKQS